MSLPNVSFQYFVGIDQSKDFFDVVIKNANKKTVYSGQFRVNMSGFKKFKKKLDSLLTDSIMEKHFILGVESTGIYHKTLFHFFTHSPYLILELNPVQVKRYAAGEKLRKTTNDRISASKIAGFLIDHHNNFAHYRKLSDTEIKLRDMTRLVLNVDKEINLYKNKIKAILQQSFPELLHATNVFSKTMISFLLSFPSISSILQLSLADFSKRFNLILPSRGKKVRITAPIIYRLAQHSIGIDSPNIVIISYLKILFTLLNEKSSVQQNIKLFIKSHPEISKQINNLTSISGVGFMSAAMFIAEIGNVTRFPQKNSVVAFAGLDPVTQQSGISINKTGHISRMGSSYLRKIMYIIAINVAKHNDYFYSWKLRKINIGGSHKKANISLAQKLIRIFYALLKSNSPFDLDVLKKSTNFKLA